MNARLFSRTISRTLARSASYKPSSGWATTSSDSASLATDFAETEAQRILEEGTKLLENGDIDSAKSLYMRSVQIKKTPAGLFNLGVTHFHSKNFPDAIKAWKESIILEPSNPDAHTNLASAYIMSPVPQPVLALEHLRAAAAISPDDAEIAFNLGAVLEACGFLEDALEQYKKSNDGGVERAAVYVRNVSAKILGQQMKQAEAEENERKD
ncbi:TPR-like protein [Clavulina sp. PMI_390]|nr:TPR-like protein [Clavulina sp. PMI_390]